MTAEALIVWLFIGAVAGWLAGTLVKGRGFGLVGDIVVGIIGAVIAGLVFPRFGVTFGAGIVNQIVFATLGAIALLLLVRLVRRL